MFYSGDRYPGYHGQRFLGSFVSSLAGRHVFNDWSCLMSVVLRNSTVATNDQWLLLKPELLWLLIVNALQLNELSALRNTFYPEYKYIYFTNISEGAAFLLQGITSNNLIIICKTLRKEDRAFRNIGRNIYVFPTVKSAILVYSNWWCNPIIVDPVVKMFWN